MACHDESLAVAVKPLIISTVLVLVANLTPIAAPFDRSMLLLAVNPPVRMATAEIVCGWAPEVIGTSRAVAAPSKVRHGREPDEQLDDA
jgi:hypothetical protein